MQGDQWSVFSLSSRSLGLIILNKQYIGCHVCIHIMSWFHHVSRFIGETKIFSILGLPKYHMEQTNLFLILVIGEGKSVYILSE